MNIIYLIIAIFVIAFLITKFENRFKEWRMKNVKVFYHNKKQRR